MSYIPNEWEVGDYVTKDKMNNIENGISVLDTTKEALNHKTYDINDASTDDEYPSARAVWELLTRIPGYVSEAALGTITQENDTLIFSDIGNSINSISLQDKVAIKNGAVHADKNYDGLRTVIVRVKDFSNDNIGTLEDMIEGKMPYIYNSFISTIGSSAFYSCRSLISASFPEATTIDAYAFQSCPSLTDVSFLAAITIGSYAFQSCSSLTNISFPMVTTIGAYAFQRCSSLRSISFPMVTTIGSYAFQYCNRLINLTISTTSLCNLYNSNAFTSTPIAGYTQYTNGQLGLIYVPESLVNTYKAALNWSYFSERIAAIQE